MECTVWKEHISTLIDGELGDADTAGLFTHLGQCPECRKFYRQLALVREHLVDGAWAAPRFPGDRESSAGRSEGSARVSVRDTRLARPLRISRALAAAAVVGLLVLGSSTTALLLERRSAATETRVIYVMDLPMIEVEATYLPNETKGL